MKRMPSSFRPGLSTLLTVAIATVLVLSTETQAGILIRTNGTSSQGQLAFIAGKGLLLTDAKGTSELIVPGTSGAVEIQASDPVWTEKFRSKFNSQSGLFGTYFERTNLDGPSRTRLDSDVKFNWKTGSPFKGWRNEHFSVRWTGSFVVPHTGDHVFFTESDDGVRLSICEPPNVRACVTTVRAPRSARRRACVRGHRESICMHSGIATPVGGWE